MLIERPPGDRDDWTVEGWAEARASQLIVPFIGRAHRVRSQWDLRKVDALEREGQLDDQIAIVLRDVDIFLMSHDRQRPVRLATVDVTQAPNEAHVDWIGFAARTMQAIGYETVPVLMAWNVQEGLVQYALEKDVRVLWWEPLKHHVEWYGPRIRPRTGPSATLVP